MAFVHFTHIVSKNPNEKKRRKNEFYILSIPFTRTEQTTEQTQRRIVERENSTETSAQTCKFNRIIQIREPKTNENVVQFLTPLLCAAVGVSYLVLSTIELRTEVNTMPISINIIFMHLLIAVSICTGLVIFIHIYKHLRRIIHRFFLFPFNSKVFELRRRCHKQSSNRCESRFPVIRVRNAIRARTIDRSSQTGNGHADHYSQSAGRPPDSTAPNRTAARWTGKREFIDGNANTETINEHRIDDGAEFSGGCWKRWHTKNIRILNLRFFFLQLMLISMVVWSRCGKVKQKKNYVYFYRLTVTSKIRL